MSQLERIYSFHQKLKDKTFPNAMSLVDEFELSRSTAHRDINYLRDRLLAPLAFDPAKNGYYYTEHDFALPFADSPRLLFFLGLLNKMADEAGLGELSEMKKLTKRLTTLIAPGYEQLINNVLCQWIEVESVTPAIFATIIECLLRGYLLEIRYRSAESDTSKRSIEPLRLINYQGRWYLLAYCFLRNSHRMFHIARIQSAVKGEKLTGAAHPAPDTLLKDAFGIFTGSSLYQAEIFFMGKAAELVRKQNWHKQQEIREEGGGIILSLPVNDPREITMKILQYGAMAEVINPPTLRNSVVEEIEKMARRYGCASSSPKG